MKKMIFILIVLLSFFTCSCMQNPQEKKKEICEEVNHLWEDFFDTEQYSISIDMKVSAKEKSDKSVILNEKAQASLKYSKSPLYFETQENGAVVLIQEEEGDLYSYTSSSTNPNLLEKTYFGNKDSLNQLVGANNEVPIEGLDIDSIEVKLVKDTYIYKVNLEDFLQNTSNEDQLKEIFSSLGINPQRFKDFWIVMKMNFFEDTAQMIMEMDFEYEGLIISIHLKYLYDHREFEKINLENYTINVEHPNSITGVHQFSSLGTTIRLPYFSTNYFKFKLEKGQYGIYATDDPSSNNWIDSWALSNLNVKFYNEKQEEIPMGLDIDSYATFPKKTFYIPEAGTYYLSVSVTVSCDMYIRLNKLNYETVVFETKQELLTSHKGTIEGEYDFDLFTTDGKEGEIVVLENKLVSPLPLLFYQKNVSSPYGHVQFVSDVCIIELHNGENKIFVCSDFDGYKYPIDYDFDVKKYVLKNGYEKRVRDLKEITTEFSDLTYIVGYSLPKPRVLLKIEKKSNVKFEFQSEEKPQFYVIVKKNEQDIGTHFYDGDSMDLEPGTYIVEMGVNSVFAECQIKYSALEAE